MDQLLAAFPKDLRFVYKHMPLTQIHANALPAAKASVAAGRQGKFWEMYDKLFQNSRNLSPENIRKMAEEIGLDLEKFERDMNSPEVEQLVQADVELARRAGVRGTPTFFLNGKRVTNRSFEALKAMIEAELKGPAGRPS